MHARLFACLSLLGAAACTTGAEGAPSLAGDEVAQEAAGALSSSDRLDGGTTCRGRQYWTCKDNRTPQHPRGDVELIDTLVPHHRMAVHMAEMEIERGSDPEAKAMAERVKRDQTDEIARLLAIRSRLQEGCSEVPDLRDSHMEEGMEEMMEMSGAALDLMFVDDMIPHHAGALQFTHYALPKLHDAELIAIANNVLDAQAMEVGELHMMKQRLRAKKPTSGGGTAPADASAAPHDTMHR